MDHICNRKQDVVYNILDWPSQTGSKVVVITIANTMDLPERVLRGCVTSRMVDYALLLIYLLNYKSTGKHSFGKYNEYNGCMSDK